MSSINARDKVCSLDSATGKNSSLGVFSTVGQQVGRNVSQKVAISSITSGSLSTNGSGHQQLAPLDREMQAMSR
ncbi:hypothetical protein AB0758_49625 [Tolypothrix bouteillei VB521301_2]|uniref:hypothetical protein n=1 Tax=Tolypothrix bouteillei TaxID=1246981 RepID=UPI0038B53460